MSSLYGSHCHCGLWCDECNHHSENCVCLSGGNDIKEEKEAKSGICPNCEHTLDGCLCTFCSGCGEMRLHCSCISPRAKGCSLCGEINCSCTYSDTFPQSEED